VRKEPVAHRLGIHSPQPSCREGVSVPLQHLLQPRREDVVLNRRLRRPKAPVQRVEHKHILTGERASLRSIGAIVPPLRIPLDADARCRRRAFVGHQPSRAGCLAEHFCCRAELRLRPKRNVRGAAHHALCRLSNAVHNVERGLCQLPHRPLARHLATIQALRVPSAAIRALQELPIASKVGRLRPVSNDSHCVESNELNNYQHSVGPTLPARFPPVAEPAGSHAHAQGANRVW
jgi:hypothetical protein